MEKRAAGMDEIPAAFGVGAYAQRCLCRGANTPIFYMGRQFFLTIAEGEVDNLHIVSWGRDFQRDV